MNSMTGYAYKECVVDGTQISVEIRSVNSRFLDLNINLPSFLNPVESKIREKITSKVVRGKIDITIRIKEFVSSVSVSVDKEAALHYWKEFKETLDFLNSSGATFNESEITLNSILNQEGVISTFHDFDPNIYWKKITPIFDEVFDSFLKERSREGENLKVDLEQKLEILNSCADFFKTWQPQMEKKFQETITAKFKELLGEHIDENRIMQETVAMLVKYTINEEIIRLKSHLEALNKELNENPAPGKRIDFICQEANREINTIGSKNQFTEVGKIVIVAKDALENIREQAKNVE